MSPADLYLCYEQLHRSCATTKRDGSRALDPSYLPGSAVGCPEKRGALPSPNVVAGERDQSFGGVGCPVGGEQAAVWGGNQRSWPLTVLLGVNLVPFVMCGLLQCFVHRFSSAGSPPVAGPAQRDSPSRCGTGEHVSTTSCPCLCSG